MAILKCKMCGGTLEYLSGQNLAVCPYCGSKSTVFDQDQKLFDQFQNQFAVLLNQSPKPGPEEGFWVEANREELVREDGEKIEIKYLAKRRADMCTMYVARYSIIYLFEERHREYAERYREMIQKIKYPNQEMEKELSKYIPELLTEYRLTDGRIFVAVRKREGVYPLQMLGILLDRHVAWIISRLENLCCLLDYNDMVLNALTPENLFVDPANHQIYLYGGWWFAGYQGAKASGASEAVIPCLGAGRMGLGKHVAGQLPRNRIRTDLESIRLTGIKLLGYADREALKQDTLLPKPFWDFLLDRPEHTPKADFARWDRVLLSSYGERKFIPLAMTEEEIYSRTCEENDSSGG